MAHALRLRLPERGEDAVRFDFPDGFAVHVYEIGASGEGTVASRAVAYQRAGGTAYWTVGATGYEEWLWLDRGVTTGDEPAAAWIIEGARLRMQQAVSLSPRGWSCAMQRSSYGWMRAAERCLSTRRGFR